MLRDELVLAIEAWLRERGYHTWSEEIDDTDGPIDLINIYTSRERRGTPLGRLYLYPDSVYATNTRFDWPLWCGHSYDYQDPELLTKVLHALGHHI